MERIPFAWPTGAAFLAGAREGSSTVSTSTACHAAKASQPAVSTSLPYQSDRLSVIQDGVHFTHDPGTGSRGSPAWSRGTRMGSAWDGVRLGSTAAVTRRMAPGGRPVWHGVCILRKGRNRWTWRRPGGVPRHPKETPMRQPHTDVQTQLPMPLPRPPRRMTQVPIVIAWLALGTDVAVLLALLTVALAPALQALVRFPTSA